MLPSVVALVQRTSVRVKKTSARVKLTSARVKLTSARVKLTLPRTAIADQRTETTDRTFSPLKRITETWKTHRTHTVQPCVTHIVVCGDNVQCEGKTAGVKNTPHARTHARTPTAPTTAAHRILCQVKKGSWDIVLHKITLI